MCAADRWKGAVGSKGTSDLPKHAKDSPAVVRRKVGTVLPFVDGRDSHTEEEEEGRKEIITEEEDSGLSAKALRYYEYMLLGMSCLVLSCLVCNGHRHSLPFQCARALL